MTAPEVRPLPHQLAAVILTHEHVAMLETGYVTLADLLELGEAA